MKETSNKKEMEIYTIGAPKFSVLSKEDLNNFITCFEFQIRDYFKDKRNKLPTQNKNDKKRHK